MGLIGDRDVVGVAAVAEQQAGVFDPADGLCDTELGHGRVSSKGDCGVDAGCAGPPGKVNVRPGAQLGVQKARPA